MKKTIYILTALLMSMAWTISGMAATAKSLKQHPEAFTKGAYVEGRVLVKMKKGVTVNALRSRIMALASASGQSGALKIKSFSFLSAKAGQDLGLIECPGLTTEKLLAELKTNANVALVEPDYMIQVEAVPDDTEFGELWALENTGQVVDDEPSAPGADIEAPEPPKPGTGFPAMKRKSSWL